MKEVEYAVYDTKDNYLCIAIMTAKEIAKMFKTDKMTIQRTASRKSLRENRYEIKRI